jgi:dTMP kinase
VKRKALVKHVELDRIERSQMDFYEKVRDGYLYLASNEKRYRKIDGTLSIQEIHKIIIDELTMFLKGR